MTSEGDTEGKEVGGAGGEGGQGTRNGWLRYLYAGWAILETMLFAGLINGWASLVFVLKEDGLYGDLCTSTPSDLSNHSDHGNVTTVQPEDDGTGCPDQDSMLNLWFTIAYVFQKLCIIAVGLHIFKFGTKSARITGWAAFIAGSLMMAFADESIPWLVLPALSALCYCGTMLMLTNVQVSCLFPRAAGVVITLVSGAYDFSATMQLVIKVLHDSGVSSRLTSYVGLCVLHAAMVMVSTLCFMPKLTSAAPLSTEDIILEVNGESDECSERVTSQGGSGDGSSDSTDTTRKDRPAVTGGTINRAHEAEPNDGATGTSEKSHVPVSQNDSLATSTMTRQNPVEDQQSREEKEAVAKGSNQGELYPDLKSCLKSAVFWLQVMWQGFLMLRLVCFFGLINTRLTTMFHGDKDKVSYFTNVQAYFMFSVMAVCWTSGAVYDWQIKLFKGSPNDILAF